MKTPASIRLSHREMVLGFLLCSGLAGAAEDPIPSERPGVLVLNSYHPGYIWSDGVMDGIRSALADGGVDPRITIGYVDTKRHDQAALFPGLATLFGFKYRQPPDLLIASDDNAFDFALQYRTGLFPGVPIVFCGFEDFDASRIEGLRRITGVVEEFEQDEPRLVRCVAGRYSICDFNNRNIRERFLSVIGHDLSEVVEQLRTLAGTGFGPEQAQGG